MPNDIQISWFGQNWKGGGCWLQRFVEPSRWAAGLAVGPWALRVYGSWLHWIVQNAGSVFLHSQARCPPYD
jgi:hypothetical protein